MYFSKSVMKTTYNTGLLFLTGVLTFAYDDLSRNKYATHSPSWFGRRDTYKAGNAVDRNITTCTRTEQIGGGSPYRSMWWKVDLDGVYNIYSVNVLFRKYEEYGTFELRQRGRFAGFSLYVSNTNDIDNSSQCYKDGPELPPLNFTTTCTTIGRYVTFYNERLHEVTYPEGYELDVFTELCEVIVKGCHNTGVYGNTCDILCPTNCRYNTCHIQNGTCFGCKPGWTERRCDIKCNAGWYGQDCKHQCTGHCKDNTVCNHVTAQCDGGCDAGWTGTLCDEECEDGTFGYNCLNNCSSYCLSKSPCNKQTGQCVGGCEPGYTKGSCNERCPLGYYGIQCKSVCSGHCYDNTFCHPVDGNCNDGCQDGYIGKQCNELCREGYYGQNCSRVCPSNCKTCKPTDVKCTCNAGWMGPNCSIGCMWSYGEDCRYPCSKHCIKQTCDRINGSCLYGCESGFSGQKCDQEYFVSRLSTLSAGFLGSAVTACVLITSAVVLFVLRKSRLFMTRNSHSLHAEVENHKGEDSTYEELNVSALNMPYQNLTLT